MSPNSPVSAPTYREIDRRADDRLNDGAGARIQEGVVSLHSYGGIFLRNVTASAWSRRSA